MPEHHSWIPTKRGVIFTGVACLFCWWKAVLPSSFSLPCVFPDEFFSLGFEIMNFSFPQPFAIYCQCPLENRGWWQWAVFQCADGLQHFSPCTAHPTIPTAANQQPKNKEVWKSDFKCCLGCLLFGEHLSVAGKHRQVKSGNVHFLPSSGCMIAAATCGWPEQMTHAWGLFGLGRRLC